jgi:hypothetical protein
MVGERMRVKLTLPASMAFGAAESQAALEEEPIEEHSGPDHLHANRDLHDHGEKPTRPQGNPRFVPHTFERAGYPPWLRDHLETSFTPGVRSHYVDGGAARSEGEWCPHDRVRG